MAKRLKDYTLKNWMTSIGLVGTPIGVVIFAYLLFMGSITVGSYEANEICGGDIDCYLILKDVCFEEDVFLYPMNPTEMIDAQPSDLVTSVELYRGWGTGWRRIPLNGTCTGSWCGCSWCTKSNTAKFSYAFREDRCYDIKYIIQKPENSTINWKINPEGSWISSEYCKEIPDGYEKIQVEKEKDIQVIVSSTNTTLKNGTVEISYVYDTVRESYYVEEDDLKKPKKAVKCDRIEYKDKYYPTKLEKKGCFQCPTDEKLYTCYTYIDGHADNIDDEWKCKCKSGTDCTVEVLK